MVDVYYNTLPLPYPTDYPPELSIYAHLRASNLNLRVNYCQHTRNAYPEIIILPE